MLEDDIKEGESFFAGKKINFWIFLQMYKTPIDKVLIFQIEISQFLHLQNL